MKMYPSITTERVLDAVERSNTGLDNPGFCIACGQEQEDCEPDMRKGPCEHCGAKAVYGAEELMMRIIA